MNDLDKLWAYWTEATDKYYHWSLHQMGRWSVCPVDVAKLEETCRVLEILDPWAKNKMRRKSNKIRSKIWREQTKEVPSLAPYYSASVWTVDGKVIAL